MKLGGMTVKAGMAFAVKDSRKTFRVITAHKNGEFSVAQERSNPTGVLNSRDKIVVSADYMESKFKGWIERPKPVKTTPAATRSTSQETDLPITDTATSLTIELRNRDHACAILPDILHDIKKDGLNPMNTLQLENYISDVRESALAEGRQAG